MKMMKSISIVGMLGLVAAAATGEEMEVVVEVAPVPFVEGSETVAVFPDTQYYSQKYPQHFESQTRWTAGNAAARDIVYALHLGDIVQDDLPREWAVAKRCLGMLDGAVPYLLTPGNHDYSNDTRETRLSEAFPVAGFEDWPTWGGVMEPGVLDNNFHLFEIHGQPWIAVGLEFGPREATMAWANKVLEAHRDRRAIIVTHGYLFYDNQRYDHRKGKQRATPHAYAGDGADGQQLWDAVVRRHPNVMVVICGHVRTGGLGYRASEGDYGNTVHEMMANYQRMRGGGMGFMRLLEFQPDGKTVQVRTFSPSTGEVRRSVLEDFTFTLQGPTRDEPRRVLEDASPLRAAPVHRYMFSGDGGGGATVRDVAGGVDGFLKAGDGSARLDGKGRLVIDRSDGDGLVELSATLVAGKTAASLEMWLTPTGEAYDWTAPVYFGDRDDAFYYTFRTLTKHRAELIDDRHNEDVQRTVSVKPGKPLHVVMTYDEAGADGEPEIGSFVNGVENGRMRTRIRLSALELESGRIGPFAGVFDEVRIYDYALSAEEVRQSFAAGPDTVVVAGEHE